MTALEIHFGQQLLIRSKQGVEPTDAGRALYRHAQVILRQVESAQAEVSVVGRELAGGVSVGLAPYSTVSSIALPLLTAVRSRYPSILLHINENFGGVLSEAMMTGRMDMALLYDAGPIKGVNFERLLTEELMVVAPAGTGLPGDTGTRRRHQGSRRPAAAAAGPDAHHPQGGGAGLRTRLRARA